MQDLNYHSRLSTFTYAIDHLLTAHSDDIYHPLLTVNLIIHHHLLTVHLNQPMIMCVIIIFRKYILNTLQYDLNVVIVSSLSS